MTAISGQQSYVLSHRRDNVEEDRRLNAQHEAIKHAILNGLLIHPTITEHNAPNAIADLGCGTGVWLDDVASTSFCAQDGGHHATNLVGFDINAHAFNPNPASGICLIEHDCTKPFDAKYFNQFDLVNIRGLAYAIPRESFPHLLENAIKLLSRLIFLEQ